MNRINKQGEIKKKLLQKENDEVDYGMDGLEMEEEDGWSDQ